MKQHVGELGSKTKARFGPSKRVCTAYRMWVRCNIEGLPKNQDAFQPFK
jgi:hypothetical protein